MGIIIHVLNIDFGYPHTFGSKSWRIAQEFYRTGRQERDRLLIFARSAHPEARRIFKPRCIGVGRFMGRLLKALRLFLFRRLPNRAIEHRVFNARLRRELAKLDPAEIAVIHSWSDAPELYGDIRASNPKVVLISDRTMGEVGADREVGGFDLYLSPSDFVTETLVVRGCPRERIVKIPYGVDSERFKPRHRAADEVFRVVFAGQVCTRKGADLLLDIWKAAGLSDAVLTLFGRVDPAMASRVASSADSGVAVGGYRDLSGELPGHHLLLLPSRLEGSAKVLMEAMACGLPVLASPESGPVFRDGSEGFVIPLDRPDLWVERLRFFHENRAALQEFGTRARSFAEAHSWERYAASVLALYDRCASAEGSS